MQHAARAVLDALTAGQVLGFLDILTVLGVQPVIDPDGAAERANAALNALHRIWHDMPGDARSATSRLITESVNHKVGDKLTGQLSSNTTDKNMENTTINLRGGSQAD